jgi:hypothetical protein
MGSQANIVVVQDGKYDLFYCHWCAASLPSDLFWGPAHAVAYARNQLDPKPLVRNVPVRRFSPSRQSDSWSPAVDASGWLNDVWAEGGAVIDLDCKTLILYGGEDLGSHIPLRRLYLQLLQEVWEGWAIRWAKRGILDMAEYVGLPKERVIDGHFASSEFVVAEPRWAWAIGSMLLEDHTVHLFPLEGGIQLELAAGPELINSMREHAGYTHLPLAEWGAPFPLAGYHVDVRERYVEYWQAAPAFDPETYIVPCWPGWRVTWLEDNYEVHLARLGDRVSLPTWSTEELLSRVQSAVMSGPALTLAAVEAMLQEIRKGGAEPRLIPLAASDNPLELPVEARQEIFARAVMAWMQKMEQ